MKKLILIISFFVIFTNFCISKDFEFLDNSPEKWTFITSLIYYNNSIVAGGSWSYFYLRENNEWKYCGSALNGLNDIVIYKDTLYAATDAGIYRSTNAGNSWEIFYNGVDYINSVSFYENKIVFCTYNSGIFISNNYGETWEDLGFKNEYFSSVLILDSTIFLGNHYGNFVISNNLGKTFEIIPGMYFNNKIRYLNKNVFVSSITGLYYSSDTGRTWSEPLLPDEYCNEIVYENEKYYLLSSSNKLFVSDDLVKWDTISYPVEPDEETYTFLIVQDTIYLSKVSGLIKSTNKGNSWQFDELSTGYLLKLMNMDEDDILIFTYDNTLLDFNVEKKDYSYLDIKDIKSGNIFNIAKENEMIVGFYNKEVFVSLDNGKSFNIFKSSKYFSALDVNFVEILNAKVYVGYKDGIYISEDTCKTWKKLGNLNEGAKSAYLSDSLFIAGTYFDGLFSSSNDGISWEFNNLNINSGINTIAIDDENWYAGVGRSDDAYYEKGVYKTSNKGISWTKCEGINYTIEKLFQYKNIIFAGSYDFGLYMSEDKGKSWEFVGLPDLRVNDLMLKDNYLYAATNIGLFRAKILDLVSVGDKKNIFESVNFFPNPAQDVLNLTNIPDGAIDFEIINQYGVQQLKGFVSKQIDVSQLPAGIYFLKLNNQTTPSKFIKL